MVIINIYYMKNYFILKRNFYSVLNNIFIENNNLTKRKWLNKILKIIILKKLQKKAYFKGFIYKITKII